MVRSSTERYATKEHCKQVSLIGPLGLRVQLEYAEGSFSREPVVLERRAAETQEDGVVKKKTSAELAALEAYLAKQREHLAAAICKEWATPNSSSERQARLKAACQELVKRSFHEVFCAREAEGSKATIGCMRRSTGGKSSMVIDAVSYHLSRLGGLVIRNILPSKMFQAMGARAINPVKICYQVDLRSSFKNILCRVFRLRFGELSF